MVAKNVGTLASEIKQKKPFMALGHEAVLGLLRTNEIVRNSIIDEIGLEDITLPQYNVLRILRGAGSDGLPTLEIANRLVERTPGVTRMINRLIDKHLVERERSKADRRIVYCSITSVGLALLKRYDKPVQKSYEVALGMLSDSETKQLVRLLDKIRAHHPSA
jgi:DNA-binding MarR family transcriptional regulator